MLLRVCACKILCTNHLDCAWHTVSIQQTLGIAAMTFIIVFSFLLR